MRNPNITELFAAQSVGNVAGIDPCAPATLQPGITFEQCARTGVTQAQWDNMSIPDCPARVCSGLGGGNPNLFAETGKTTTYGIVFTPSAIPTLAVSLDYYKIRIEDYIGSISPTLSLSQCISTGDPYFCNLINRDPATGAIFGYNTDGGYITNTNLNTGYLETKGYDISASYTLPLSTFFERDYGSVAFSMIGTYLKSLETESVPGLGSYDCKGLYGPVCGQPAPEWRHSIRATWSTPWTDAAYLPASVSLNWRHIGEVGLASNTGKPFLTGTRSVIDQKIPAIGYIDVATTFNLPRNFVLRAGINNLMDVAPPSVMDGLLVENGNGNTYPGTYEALGRMLFVGVSAKF
ncbi:MAG: hypothetical protein B7Z26_08780 [Asticcacaulis sp. 32-58-5]|nr:MAG: hypothetical protein B7Z26_08780 [Asticcacaulis sp. 32-58-5]